MTREPVRAGIIGLGRSGWDIHATALADHTGFRVVAVADPVAERREEPTIPHDQFKTELKRDGLL